MSGPGGRRDDDSVAGPLFELCELLADPLPDQVSQAVALARRGHDGQVRRSGEPYLSHPLATAVLLAQAGWDTTTIAAGVCHDLLEDTDVTRGEIAAVAGEDTARIVEGVTRMDQVRTKDAAAEAADLQRLLGAVAGDVRVLAVKLADRLHNIRTLEHLPEAKRERIARQTLEILAPLAHRIGAQAWAAELEDRCFYWAYREQWLELDDELSRSAADRDELAERVTSELSAALAHHGVRGKVEHRAKGRWSTWRKLSRVGRLDRVWDQVGVRVVVEDRSECYTVLGIVHGLYTPVPGRVKDYIAMPKDSGYRSLHTTLVDGTGQYFEVQIRDEEMDLDARYGSAAHHRYKASPARRVPGPAVETDGTHLGPEEFLEELRQELSDTAAVLALTPNGDVVTLPAGSCAIDFAYAVHTEVGHRCVGAKVNGKLTPIRAALSTGDTVEIMTRDKASPSRDWLDAVASARARSRIRRHFSSMDREEHERIGRASLDEAMALRGLTSLPDGTLRRCGAADLAELWRLVGSGRTSVSRVLGAPRAPERHPTEPGRLEPRARPFELELSGLRSQVAGCCTPTPTDHLVGYVSVGRGLIVHLASCPNLVALRASLPAGEQGRILDLAPPGACTMVVESLDRDGLLADVAGVFAAAGVSLTGSSTVRGSGTVTLNLGLPELDGELREALLGQVRAVRSVTGAQMRHHG